jgi:PAS domain S-box-containing protein
MSTITKNKIVQKVNDSDLDSKDVLSARIKQLENELKVAKEEHENTIQKYIELNSSVEEQVKDRSNKLKDVQLKLEKKTRELEQERNTLKNTEQRFKDLFQNSPEAIIVIDLKHKIVAINPAACFMYNKTKRELVGAKPYFNAPEEMNNKLVETYNQICESKQSYIESNFWTTDGTIIPVEISSSRIQYLGKPSIVLHIHDISVRLEAEKEIRKAMETINTYNQKLEQMLQERTKDLIKTERHAAFSLLIQGIVHNLRNPLTVVSGGAEMILMGKEKLEKDKVNIPEDVKKPLELSWKNAKAILESTNKLVKMINSLMAKSKSDNTDKVETVDLNDIVNQELEFMDTDTRFKHKTKKSIYLINDKLNVNIVPSELSQVFQNLVGNALDALYNNPDAMLEIYTGRSDDEVWFSLQDNGPGIPKEIQSKIFDPFFSTKPKAKTGIAGEPVGTGLGLYICSEMVHAYGGKIEVKSKPGTGTKVTVYIPAVNNI